MARVVERAGARGGRRGRALFSAPVAVDALPRPKSSAPRAPGSPTSTASAFSIFTATASISSATATRRWSRRSAARWRRLPFCPRRYSNPTATALARRLVETAPAGLDKTLFAPSGSAAVGMALKLARYATGRHKTLSFWDSFHGATLDAIGVGGEALVPPRPRADDCPAPNTCRRSTSRAASSATTIRSTASPTSSTIRSTSRATSRADRRAAALDDGRAAAARLLAARARVLRAAWGAADLRRDPELPGALGAMYACQRLGATPDILVIGKGLGGGIMPLAAMLAAGALDCAPDAALGHYTHEKSPVASRRGAGDAGGDRGRGADRPRARSRGARPRPARRHAGEARRASSRSAASAPISASRSAATTRPNSPTG